MTSSDTTIAQIRWDVASNVLKVPTDQFVPVYNASLAVTGLVAALAPSANSSWTNRELPLRIEQVSDLVTRAQDLAYPDHDVPLPYPFTGDSSDVDHALRAFSAGLTVNPLIWEAVALMRDDVLQGNLAQARRYGHTAFITWPRPMKDRYEELVSWGDIAPNRAWNLGMSLLRQAKLGLQAIGVAEFDIRHSLETATRHILSLLAPDSPPAA